MFGEGTMFGWEDADFYRLFFAAFIEFAPSQSRPSLHIAESNKAATNKPID